MSEKCRKNNKHNNNNNNNNNIDNPLTSRRTDGGKNRCLFLTPSISGLQKLQSKFSKFSDWMKRRTRSGSMDQMCSKQDRWVGNHHTSDPTFFKRLLLTFDVPSVNSI